MYIILPEVGTHQKVQLRPLNIIIVLSRKRVIEIISYRSRNNTQAHDIYELIL